MRVDMHCCMARFDGVTGSGSCGRLFPCARRCGVLVSYPRGTCPSIPPTPGLLVVAIVAEQAQSCVWSRTEACKDGLEAQLHVATGRCRKLESVQAPIESFGRIPRHDLPTFNVRATTDLTLTCKFLRQRYAFHNRVYSSATKSVRDETKQAASISAHTAAPCRRHERCGSSTASP